MGVGPGDLAREEVREEKESAFSPVEGGVGPGNLAREEVRAVPLVCVRAREFVCVRACTRIHSRQGAATARSPSAPFWAGKD
jgi:hypothetical protein